MKTYSTSLIAILALLAVTGCALAGAVGNAPTATPAPPSDTAAPTVDTAATQSAQQTAEAQAKTNAETTRMAQETEAVHASATARRDAEATIKAGPRATYEVAFNLTQTAMMGKLAGEAASVQASATAQIENFANVIGQLMEEGVVGTNEGDYYRLDDFDESWAQIGYYQWWNTGFSAENFVLSADVAWQSASDKANWPQAGCGIVFSEDDRNDHHLAYLSLEGYGVLARIAKGEWQTLAAQPYGKVEIPDGNAKLMLVVYNKKLNFYVNEKHVTNAYDNSVDSGIIALTLLSGTNKDFGTHCEMSNIHLWIFR